MGVPERIGRYLVTGDLGQGAMGTVYRGRDDSLDRDVAIKVMSRGLADAGARARFLREARAAAKLQHPNIIVIYELGEHEGAPFMALELLEGVDLQRAIDGGIRPDPRATLPVVLQVLAGLGHAHVNGIVHRDVKPSNVFLPFGRPAKIMDFGVARLSGLGTTTSGVVTGTPNYMSPEQVQAGDVDGRSDLFSAGLILYELVTGEKAFQADSVVALMYKIVHEAPDLGLIPGGPQWARLRAVLERALARRPSDRYPDAAAMSADLALALEDLGGKADGAAPADQALLVRPKPAVRPPPAPAEAATRPPETAAASVSAPVTARGSRRGAVVLAAATAAVVGLGAWLVWRPPWRASDVSPPPAPGPAASASAAVPAPASTPPSAEPVRTAGPSSRSETTPLASSPAPAPPVTEAASPPPETPPATPTPEPAPGLGAEARLVRARDFLDRGRYPEALAEARAVLEASPTNAQAAALAQQAEAELVIEDCLRNAREALRTGDRDRALEEVRRGFLVRKNDPRLLAMHREAVQH
jgi:serine/threonine-protein kinase